MRRPAEARAARAASAAAPCHGNASGPEHRAAGSVCEQRERGARAQFSKRLPTLSTCPWSRAARACRDWRPRCRGRSAGRAASPARSPAGRAAGRASPSSAPVLICSCCLGPRSKPKAQTLSFFLSWPTASPIAGVTKPLAAKTPTTSPRLSIRLTTELTMLSLSTSMPMFCGPASTLKSPACRRRSASSRSPRRRP